MSTFGRNTHSATRGGQTVLKALTWAIPLLFLVIFFYQPMAAIIRLVFAEQFSGGWQLINAGDILRPLEFTFSQAALSTLLTLLLGIPAAYLFSHYKFAGKNLLNLVSTLPFILPTVVVAAGFNALLGPRGLLNLGLMDLFELNEAPIRFVNSIGAILVVHVFYNITIVIRIVSNAMASLDQRLAQAAKTLGATPMKVLTEITLPLLTPAVLSATLLVFLFDFTSFGVILLMGGPGMNTIEVAIYKQVFFNLNLPLAGLLSIVQLVITFGVTILYNRVTHRNPAGRLQHIEPITAVAPKTRGAKAAIFVLVVLLLLFIVSPMAALVGRSFSQLEPARGEGGDFRAGISLAYYRELFSNRQDSLFYVPPLLAIKNSLVYALATIGITLPLGFLLAYALNQKGRWKNWLEPVIMLPLGASAVTLGLGLLVVFYTQNSLFQTLPILIPIAHSLIALPFVVRILMPALGKIPGSLREAARSLGASPRQVIREIDMPLLFRSAVASAIFAFTISVGEFGASSFIASPTNPTIPVAIYRYISQPGGMNYGQALAMSSILLVTCLLGVMLIEKTRIPGEEVF